MLQLGVAKRKFLQTGLLNAAGMKSAEVNSEHIGVAPRHKVKSKGADLKSAAIAPKPHIKPAANGPQTNQGLNEWQCNPARNNLVS